MRNFIAGALCAFSISAIAVTDNPDGSVTLTKEEAANLIENFQRMEGEISRLEGEVEKANTYFKVMQKRMAECQAKAGKPV
jgi:hypothetical protein